jgi:predicted anti-sigma-YlaC factor YlaD
MRSLTCKELIDFLDDYLSEELDPIVQSEFESHLAQCSACRDYLHTYCQTIKLVRMSRDDAEAKFAASVPNELIAMVLSVTRDRGVESDDR